MKIANNKTVIGCAVEHASRQKLGRKSIEYINRIIFHKKAHLLCESTCMNGSARTEYCSSEHSKSITRLK